MVTVVEVCSGISFKISVDVDDSTLNDDVAFSVEFKDVVVDVVDDLFNINFTELILKTLTYYLFYYFFNFFTDFLLILNFLLIII